MIACSTGPTIVGYGLEGALKFGFYESCKVILLHATPYVFINLLMASVIAGAIASVVLVRIVYRMQVEDKL
jgi:solute carrier family 25 phosphate transporter 3